MIAVQRKENSSLRACLYFLICLVFLGCSDNPPVEDEDDDGGGNVLKEYINTPKDQALGVKNKLESRSAEQNRQLGIE